MSFNTNQKKHFALLAVKFTVKKFEVIMETKSSMLKVQNVKASCGLEELLRRLCKTIRVYVIEVFITLL